MNTAGKAHGLWPSWVSHDLVLHAGVTTEHRQVFKALPMYVYSLLFERQSERGEKSESPSAGLLPRWLEQGQAEIRSQGFHPGPTHKRRDLNIWVIFCSIS